MPFGTKKKREQLTGNKLAELREKMGDLKVLIIDEISMVDNEMWLDISHRLCKIKEREDLPFGGVHVLAVGDLFQLLPVKGRPVWQMQTVDSNSNIQGYPLGLNIWEDNIKMYELNEIMRQRDEKEWAQFLNRLRESPLRESDREYINERIIASDHAIIPDANYITLTNDKCDIINNIWFLSAPTDQRYVIAADDVHSGNAPISPASIQSNIETVDRGEVQNLPAKLNLAIGHEYDFVINLDTIDGITNGTPCIAMKYQKHSPKGDIIWVDPRDPRVGKYWRQTYRYLYDDSIPNIWLPVIRHSLPCKSKYFTRKQFPLRASKARTVNRTQGATLSKIVVDFSDKKGHTSHCHYVAFSRCPSKSNVYIQGQEGLAESKIRHDVRCIQEMERLRQTALLKIELPCLFDFEEEYNSIYFLNAQSAVAKIKALENDWNIKGSSIVGLADTRFEPGREKHLTEFHNDPVLVSNNDRPTLGIAVYAKLSYDDPMYQFISDCHGVEHGSMVVIRCIDFLSCDNQKKDLWLIFLYILPEAPNTIYERACDYFAQMLAYMDIPMAILGDFNKNPEQLPKIFKEKMKKLGLKQLIKNPTHIRGNILDHIYTNLDPENVKFGILNTLTKSDHSPIFLSVKKCIN